jgi:5-methylcytosine-specific restriction endonuclease McrA
VREELPEDDPWPGYETRPGWFDIKREVQERDNWTCAICKRAVAPDTCEVDHLRPYSCFKRPVDANRPENLWALCIDCHRRKTENERRMESRVR